MASKFVVPVRDQSFLELVSYREVLGDDHLVWTVIEVVEGLDLSQIYERYAPDVGGGGRPALDPSMLVALLFFGYCEGKRSSRQLEDACVRDWAYRAICGGLAPDHATIARFRQGMDEVLEGLFVEVLMACADAGMIDVGVVALDGTRMGSVASKEANRSEATLAKMEVEARSMLDEAAMADNSTSDAVVIDDTISSGSSDEDDEGGGVAAGNGGSGRVSSESRRRTEQVRRGERIRQAQQVVAEAGVRREAEEVKRSKPKNSVANVTDPESRLQKTRGGFIQGYNAQSVVSGDQVVVACDVTANSTDQAQLAPMLEASKMNVVVAGVTDPIGVALADAGYASQANFDAEAGLGIGLLVATGKTSGVGKRVVPDTDIERDRERIDVFKRVDAGDCTLLEAAEILGLSTGWVSKLYGRYRHHGSLASEPMLAWRAMDDRLSEPANRELYKKRGWMIEGSFAHIKTHRGTDRFLRHGLAACKAEWNLINIAGNLRKLHHKRTRSSHAPPLGQPGRKNRPIWVSQTVSSRSGIPKQRFHAPARHPSRCTHPTT